jgi:hypothetical protein
MIRGLLWRALGFGVLAAWGAPSFAQGVGSFTVTPSSLSFPSTVRDAQSAAQSITVRNSGSGALQLVSIFVSGTAGADFLTSNNCPQSLPKDGSCTVSVRFKPTVIGSRSAAIEIKSSTTTRRVTLRGAATAPPVPVVTLSPTSVSFPGTASGSSSAAQTVKVRNTGTAPLQVATITVTGAQAGDFAASNTCGAAVAVNASCSIAVTFKPTTTGSRSATLEVKSNAAAKTLSLKGTGAVPPAPGVTLSPTSLTFGSTEVGSSSAARVVTLRNSGKGALEISTISVLGAQGAEFKATNTCGATIAPSGTCTITVGFTPSAIGERTATIEIRSNATTRTLALKGTGAAAVALACAAPDPNATTGSTFDVVAMKAPPYQHIDGTAGNDHFFHRPVDLQRSGAASSNFKGGPGNDRLEGNGWGLAVYWDSPKGVLVRLDQGCANDGFGARDTLSNIRGAFGSSHDDTLIGDRRNNVFWTMGGSKDYVNGGDGEDIAILSMDPATVSSTRKSATVWEFTGAPRSNPTARGTVTLENVEAIQFYDNNQLFSRKLITGPTPQDISFGMPLRLTSSRSAIQTDFFAVQQFGFHIESINERSGAFYYPTEADFQPPGSFTLDPHSMVTGDFNGDKREDLLVSWAVFNHTISHKTPVVPVIFLNKGDGTLGPANEVMSGPMPLRHFAYRTSVADFNGDGADDIVIGTMMNPNSPERLPGVKYQPISDPIVLLLSQPGGKMIDSSARIEGQESGAAPKGRVGSFSHDMTSGDLDGDGDVDIYTSGALLINDGTGRFSDRSSTLPAEARRTDTYVMSSATGDLDGDGAKDLIVAYAEGNARYAFLSGGRGVSGARVVVLPEGTYGRSNTKNNHMATADINRDGLVDIVIAETRALPYYQGRRLQLLINRGNGVFVDESDGRLDNQPYDKMHGEGQLYLRDMNGDGAVDIVHATGNTGDSFGNDLSGGLNVFFNDGAGKFRSVSPSVFAFANQSDVAGFGLDHLVSSGFVQRAVPIRLSPTGGVDFVSHVKVSWWQPDPPTPNAVILYVMRSRKVLN